MQQIVEIPYARPFPGINKLIYKEEMCEIEKEALMLQADVASGDLPKTRAILQQLQQLSGMVGRIGSKSSQVQSILSLAIAKARHHIEELEMEEDRKGHNGELQAKFEHMVYDYMSVHAQKFYDEINVKTSYTIAPVNNDGEIVAHAAKKIHGKTLRRLLSLIKFHSLDTDHKKKILHATFGADAVAGEGTPKDIALLETRKKELFALHAALDDMEAYKAFILSRKYQPDVAEEMIEKNHKVIIAAHEQIDEVITKYDALIDDIHNGLAMATLKAAKLKMKKLLNEDVINQVLLEQSSDTITISGGVATTHAISGFERLLTAASFLPPHLF